MAKKRFDYIVAGGGSAGCTLAARLCEDKNLEVLLVEAGGNGRSLFTRMPAGNGILIGNPKFDWGLASVPQEGMMGGSIYYPRGLGLGGSSLLNGMIYIRGHRKDYDEWAVQGLRGWSYADVLPYFKKASAAGHRADDPYHGTQGPLKLSPAPNYNHLSRVFLDACLQAGLPMNEDFNGRSQWGVGRFDAKAFDGVRQSSSEAYLSNKPDNLTILTGTRVLGIDFEGVRAAGLKLDCGTVSAKREVILSMGAFHSPQLLMLSGIGPASHLEQVGVDVRLDLPGVGCRLFDHPNMPIQFDITDPSLSLAQYQRIDKAAWMGIQYLANRSGPGGGPFWSVLFFEALRDRERPELEVFLTPMVVRESADGGGWNIQTLMNPGRSVIARGKMARPGFQLDMNLLRPRSFGTVRLADNDPLSSPLIDPAYLSDEDDLSDLVAGVHRMREIVSQPALKDIVAAELSPGPAVKKDRDIAASIRKMITTGHHPVGTCAMGADNNNDAVLDSELKVRGVENLRVVDGSSFPGQVSGNVNAPIIMLAEKAADLILGRPPLKPYDPGKADD